MRCTNWGNAGQEWTASAIELCDTVEYTVLGPNPTPEAIDEDNKERPEPRFGAPKCKRGKGNKYHRR